MKFEQGIWADSETSKENELYVSILEQKIREYVDGGRLPQDVAAAILQKIEVYPKTLVSEADARHKAEAFFELQIMPIIYEFDELLRGEANLATQQGNLMLKKEHLENKDPEFYDKKIKNLEKTIEWIDGGQEELLDEKENLRRDIIN